MGQGHLHDETLQLSQKNYFKGFERSAEFEQLWFRLKTLELWKELAIRPSKEDCHEEDKSLLQNELDDLQELQERCNHVRHLLNKNLPPIEQALDKFLIPKKSRIPNAGLGLFYEPESPNQIILKGTVVCYYTGNIHSFHSSKKIKDKSYLMMVRGDVLVDPGPLKHIKARYINDPLNEEVVNCKYVPEELRSAVVTTRVVIPGEELFASYGDAYWSNHKSAGRTFLN